MKRGIFCRVGMRHKGGKDAILTREPDDQGVHTWPSQEDLSCGLLPDGHSWLKNSSTHTYRPVSIYTASDGLKIPFASLLQITQSSCWKGDIVSPVRSHPKRSAPWRLPSQDVLRVQSRLERGAVTHPHGPAPSKRLQRIKTRTNWTGRMGPRLVGITAVSN